jgi:hypothetical protein
MIGKFMAGWDSDAAPWATLTVDITIDFNVNITAPATPPLNTGWDTTLTASGSLTKTFTFTRVAFDPDNDAAVNRWYVVGGHFTIGEPTPHPSKNHRSAGVFPTQTASGSPVFGYPSPADFALVWADTSEPWDIDYTIVYNPGVDATPPADDSGTLSDFLLFGLSVNFLDGVPTWTGDVGFGGSLLPEATLDTGAHARLNIPGLLDADDGPTVSPVTLKDGGGGTDFGVTLNSSTAQPGSPFSGTATADISVVITCS